MEEKIQSNVDAALIELSELITEMEEQPENVHFLRRQIALTQILGMGEETLDAYAKLSGLIMLQEDEWIAYLNQFIGNLPKLIDIDAFLQITEKYVQAEKDYLSLPVLLKHSNFIISCYNARYPVDTSEIQDEISVGEEITEFLDIDTTRGLLQAITKQGLGILSESQQLWQLWIDWEMSILERTQKELEQIHEVYLERLSTPHSTIDQTTSNYSSFCSTYCNEEYEQRLVRATEVSQNAKYKWNGEKRFGKTREDFELQLVCATELTAQAQIFLEYTKWESNARTKSNAHGRTPNADIVLTGAVFERAVLPYAKLAAIARVSLDSLNIQIKEQTNKSKGKGKGKGKKKDEDKESALTDQKKMIEETIRAFKDAEAGIWMRHAAWAEEAIGPVGGNNVRMRMVKAVPHSGDAWTDLLRDNLFLAKAAYEARLGSTSVSLGAVPPTLATITRGLDSVTRIHRSGDSSLRLEKFVLDWAETKAPEYLDQALLVLDKPIKSRSSSYQFALLRTGVEVRRDDIATAREIFEKAIQRTDLDWPEAVYEAFIQLEVIHGTPQSLHESKKKIDKEQEKLLKRREKVAAEVSAYHAQYPVAVNEEGTLGAIPAIEDGRTGVEIAQEAVITSAESAANETAPSASVPAPSHSATEIKRNREQTTILVSGLPKGVTLERIETFFFECGAIRETTVVPDKDSMHDSALVEFKRVESIPDVLEKDQKKFEGSPIRISMLWRSTLYVTNFPREMDDKAIRSLFGQYGRILDTRWPSRKYADTRRFCYVTMESPAAAQECLVLHGYKVPDASTNFGLTVLVSDPEAKVKRSDAANSTLFVGGLNSKTTENEIQGLFKDYGRISNLKLGWNPEKRICRGFAFVEMSTEAEAKAALQLHGTQYRGNDPDKAAEKRLRSVRLSNLPENSQEGLLQQQLEKIVPVRRLELFAKTHEAVAELGSQADVGKLLLQPEPFVFNGNKIVFTEQGKRQVYSKKTEDSIKKDEDTKSVSASGPSTMFAPRAARKALAKPRPTAVAAAKSIAVAGQVQAHDQNDFRAMVSAKNKERQDRLVDAREANSGDKRKLEGEEQGEENKRSRI
ncbi:uncharacterized protein L203_101899 [Cryptococcus depauperatus CBS 7841]|uniref:U4/U6 snRNA-associated-splicing factor PRP24 n=1 Tax=Cryptococcus depauperatus CBS 7841 TaxID=1295531 RepID=A0AAJ8JQY6_9TREE